MAVSDYAGRAGSLADTAKGADDCHAGDDVPRCRVVYGTFPTPGFDPASQLGIRYDGLSDGRIWLVPWVVRQVKE